jgi:Protein of unknown function (DUF2917)
MVCDGYTKVWDLAAGEIVRLDGARGTTLRVTRGRIWVTLERDLHDFVLEAGDVFTIERGGLTIVEAQDAAAVCVMARHVDEHRVRPGARDLRPRLLQWLRQSFQLNRDNTMETLRHPPLGRG